MSDLLVGRWMVLDDAGNAKYSDSPPTTWGKAYEILAHIENRLLAESDNHTIMSIEPQSVRLLPKNYLGLKEKWKLNKLCTDTEGLLYTLESDQHGKAVVGCDSFSKKGVTHNVLVL